MVPQYGSFTTCFKILETPKQTCPATKVTSL